MLSLSPEQFFRLSNGQIEAKPMKGTAPRRADPAADRAEAEALAADPKQRAENLMIVDLLRNDLARVAETGSVAARIELTDSVRMSWTTSPTVEASMMSARCS